MGSLACGITALVRPFATEQGQPACVLMLLAAATDNLPSVQTGVDAGTILISQLSRMHFRFASAVLR